MQVALVAQMAREAGGAAAGTGAEKYRLQLGQLTRGDLCQALPGQAGVACPVAGPVAAPVAGRGGKAELIDEVTAAVIGKRLCMLTEPSGVLDFHHAPALATNRLLLEKGGAPGHHGNEFQPQPACQPRFRNRGGARGGFDHRAAGRQPILLQGLLEQRHRQAMLERAAGMRPLVLDQDARLAQSAQAEFQQRGYRGGGLQGRKLHEAALAP